MKLVTYLHDGKEYIGSYENDHVVPLKSVLVKYDNMNDLISNMDVNDIIKLQNKIDNCSGLELSKLRLISPIPKPKSDIICLGVNYKEHLIESLKFKKLEVCEQTEAVYFSKRAYITVGDNGIIDPHFDIVDSLDYEVELGVIIGKKCVNATMDNAMDYVFGYTIANDFSARNVQNKHKQWYFGKSLDTFTALGPWIVTKDEITDLSLDIKSYVNGQLRQNSNTKYMTHDIKSIIVELSKGMTLDAGTIIITGTPSGVGMGFNPPKFLKSNDKIECVIEKIGKLTNIIK